MPARRLCNTPRHATSSLHMQNVVTNQSGVAPRFCQAIMHKRFIHNSRQRRSCGVVSKGQDTPFHYDRATKNSNKKPLLHVSTSPLTDCYSQRYCTARSVTRLCILLRQPGSNEKRCPRTNVLKFYKPWEKSSSSAFHKTQFSAPGCFPSY